MQFCERKVGPEAGLARRPTGGSEAALGKRLFFCKPAVTQAVAAKNFIGTAIFTPEKKRKSEQVTDGEGVSEPRHSVAWSTRCQIWGGGNGQVPQRRVMLE